MVWHVKDTKKNIAYNVKVSGKWTPSEIRSDILEELLSRLDWHQHGDFVETDTMRVPAVNLVSGLAV